MSADVPPSTPPVLAILAGLAPVLGVVVPFCVGITDDDHGSFRSMIAMRNAILGGVFGSMFGVIFASRLDYAESAMR